MTNEAASTVDTTREDNWSRAITFFQSIRKKRKELKIERERERERIWRINMCVPMLLYIVYNRDEEGVLLGASFGLYPKRPDSLDRLRWVCIDNNRRRTSFGAPFRPWVLGARGGLVQQTLERHNGVDIRMATVSTDTNSVQTAIYSFYRCHPHPLYIGYVQPMCFQSHPRWLKSSASRVANTGWRRRRRRARNDG